MNNEDISCTYQTAILVTGATSSSLALAATGSWPQPPSTWSALAVLAESAKSVGRPEPFVTLGSWPQPSNCSQT